ncbi:endolysin [Mycobacterium phage Taptic]|uniref:Lysin A n=1 Tax=Mycobacterium phage Taptic TaxID=1920305 RepID=A0A1J0MDM1_9CAUD|nr:endolysin [Mycobacterium phage Taptic]APD19266.1 lysin A [Mycobacterium phage Taptic]AVO21346.1 lysin A [Mycobacterium phage Megabear]WRQ08218.1 lysin A [Mycobacterium phage harman]
MAVARANVEATKTFIRARLGNPYVYGGALSPTNVKQGTDCSEIWQTTLEMTLGRYVPGRQGEGATTESYRPKSMGGPIPDGGIGPFGTIVTRDRNAVPANAVAKIGLHHGPGGGANSHMWGELDGMGIESRGGGVGVITNPRSMRWDDSYANAFAYLPGPITEDGTPAAPEYVLLGRNYENSGDRVRQLQRALNSYGYGLDEDGEYGPLTEQAVGAFQRSKGLEVDGIAGPVTLAALGLTFGRPVESSPEGLALFRQIMSRTDATNAWLATCLPYYIEAMRAAEINTPLRAAAFASQIGHETSGLKDMAEIQTNGPGWTEDRRIYRGRGAIQLTWSSNYRRFGQWCREQGHVTDPELFVKNPELVEHPQWGFLAASWYWRFGGPKPGQINSYADKGDILAVSRCVNGWIDGVDPVGWADRRSRYLNCMALGDRIMNLTTVDPLEELLKMKLNSMSIYRTPGEGPIDAAIMLAALDAHGPHEDYVEKMARRGDEDALFRVARVAMGKGAVTTPAAIKQATDVLLEIAATNRAAVNEALGKV